MRCQSIIILWLLSLKICSQTSSDKIETSTYFVLDCIKDDTVLSSFKNADKYKRLELYENTNRYNIGEFGSCVIPDGIEKFIALDTLITKGIGLTDQLSSLPKLSFLSTDSYYIPKLPALISFSYSAVGDSLPANLLYSKALKNLSFNCTGENVIGFDDYRERNIFKPNDWYSYFESIATLKSLETLHVDRAFDGYNFSVDTMSHFPESLYEFKYLTKLDIPCPSVSTISSSIAKLSKLRYLRIASPQDELPIEISKLIDLDTLILYGDMSFPKNKWNYLL